MTTEGTSMNKSAVVAFLDAEINRLQRAKELLSGADGAGRNGSYGHSSGRLTTGIRRRRRMSAEARRKISEAQKKRWAARKKSQ
jgi:hypothetical protein